MPRYRGNAARNWAIINGEKEFAQTIHLMIAELDAGPIVLKKKAPIFSDTYIGELYDFVNNHTPSMFADSVDGFENETIIPTEQPKDPKKSLRGYPRLPLDSEIDWTKSATFIDRVIRASSEPFMGAYTHLDSEKFIIWRAHVEKPEFSYLASPGQILDRRKSTGEVVVATGEGFLVIEDAETEEFGRKKPIKIIKTIRTRLGLDISNEIVKCKREISDLKKLFEET